jgi:hypothetical protein
MALARSRSDRERTRASRRRSDPQGLKLAEDVPAEAGTQTRIVAPKRIR